MTVSRSHFSSPGFSIWIFELLSSFVFLQGGIYKEGDREWFAQEIGILDKTCGWMPEGFMSVDTSLGAGRAFLRSLYSQYRDWGVDFGNVTCKSMFKTIRASLMSCLIEFWTGSGGARAVKHDCVFGDDLSLDEITYVSQVLAELDRPIIYSLSPGTHVTPEKARQVSGLVNMYRIAGDDWDKWGDVEAHFDVTRWLTYYAVIRLHGLRSMSD